MLQGIDISSYQGDVDFSQVKGHAGFVFAKATEGTTFTDDKFRQNHDGAKAAGIPFGAYHFLRFNCDPQVQAQHFLDTIDGYAGQLLPMVDVEVTDGLTSPKDIADRIAAFMDAVEFVIKDHMILYSYYGFWNNDMQGYDGFSGHPFWLAEYNNDPTPTMPHGFKDWVLWQYSSQGSVPGIVGNVDMDRLNGEDISLIEGH